MKLHKLFPLTLILISCATPPQSAEDFRQSAFNSKLMAKSEVNMKGTTLTTVKQRLQNLADQCLTGERKAACVTPDAQCPGGSSVYSPSIEGGSEKVSLYLQQRWTDGVMTLQKTPENGKYILLAEVQKKADGSLYGVVLGPKGGAAANLAEDVSKWILGQMQDCPQLP